MSCCKNKVYIYGIVYEVYLNENDRPFICRICGWCVTITGPETVPCTDLWVKII